MASIHIPHGGEGNDSHMRKLDTSYTMQAAAAQV